MNAIMEATGYVNVFDFYHINEKLGEGRSGSVHAGINIKTGKLVAIKIISKYEKNLNEIMHLHRELNTMKVC